MKTITIELVDEVYEVLQQDAAKTGRPIEDLALEWRAKHRLKPRPKLTDEERRAARERLLRFSEGVNSGDPHSADNERVDRDIEREYGDTHEGD